MKQEIWKEIEGFEGIYEISNFGKIRSVDRAITYVNGRVHVQHGVIRKAQIATNGYEIIDLSKNHVRKKFLVHRLVAIAFIPNPNNLPEVNHIDENKLHNYAENLEWCGIKENRNFGTRNIRARDSKDYARIGRINQLKQGRKIAQIDSNGEIVRIFPSIREAERVTGYFRQAISGCCNGLYKQAYGYRWKFMNCEGPGC